MLLYKDNKDLDIQVVTTVTGEKEYRRNCRLIKEQYYRMNDDCFYVKGTWYRVNSGKIAFDEETKNWVIINETELIKGIIAISQEGEYTRGHFTPNLCNNVRVKTNIGTENCISAALLEDNPLFFEDSSAGVWYQKNIVSESEQKSRKQIRNEIDHHRKGYNIEDNAGEYEDKKESYKNWNPKLSKDCLGFGKLLGNLTYGLEAECSTGNLSPYLQYRHGVVICRDGSIEGPEHVVVPMAGAKGINNIKELMGHLQRQNKINIDCSLHYHFGNVPLDRNYVVALYILGLKIQDQLYQMFPYYKTDPRDIKRKNYCQKLKKMGIHPLKDTSEAGYRQYVNDVFEKIFTFLGEGTAPDENWNTKTLEHPIKAKWDRTESR